MKINYVPGLPLRLFPQNSRDPYTAFKTFTQSDCDFVLMTGNCPDTDTTHAKGHQKHAGKAHGQNLSF